jgi:hypothetical protein
MGGLGVVVLVEHKLTMTKVHRENSSSSSLSRTQIPIQIQIPIQKTRMMMKSRKSCEKLGQSRANGKQDRHGKRESHSPRPREGAGTHSNKMTVAHKRRGGNPRNKKPLVLLVS